MTTTTALQSQTPTEIDIQIAEIMDRAQVAEQALARLHQRVQQYEATLANETYAFMRDAYTASLNEVLAAIPAADAKVAAIYAEAAPLHAEYSRRGGWTRAFLVTNTGGHVHNTMSCGTCFPSTRFAWLPEVSGAPEAEIVERAGEGACTVCYPTAPVNVLKRPNTFEAPDRKAARLEREAKAAAKAAKAAATGIANADGSPLRGSYGIIRTERTAQVELVDHLACHTAYGYSLDAALVQRLTAALAAKRGQTEEQVAADVHVKVLAKIKRDARQR